MKKPEPKYQPDQCLNCRMIKGVDCSGNTVFDHKKYHCLSRATIWDDNGKFIPLTVDQNQ